MEKHCLSCQAPIKGRSDKKFCDDSCRNNYNNVLHSDANNFVRNINNILRKNRRILEELSPQGKAKVSKTKLIEKGFNFNYHTNITTTKAGSKYTFCYELGYLPLEADYFLIVAREDK